MKSCFTCLIYCTLLYFTIVCVDTQTSAVVETVYGSIRGEVDTTLYGDFYEKYLGIPFATPPLGQLRFAKSVPPQPWAGIRDTTQFPKGCIEVNNSTETSEDCLYLNVYVPGQNRSVAGLTVMVYIHGGAYFLGSAHVYPGQDLAVHGDVIVVTVSYRLGALGFLSTEDEAAPGNWGLWDVKLALEWVRDNIAAFGGSPDRVTVFGQSAGGAITSHVMISPQTQSMLQRGICISGTSSGYFGISQPGSVAMSTKQLARTLLCPNVNDSYALVNCLLEKDAHQLNYWGTMSVIMFRQQPPNFMPVIDGEFIPVHPASSWNHTAPGDLDLLTGAVIHDGASSVLLQSTNNPNITINMAATPTRTQAFLDYLFSPYGEKSTDIQQALLQYYPDIIHNNTVRRTEAVSELHSDYYFHTGQHYEAQYHSKVTGGTYMYQYAYPISFLNGIKHEDHRWMIADHSDDLFMIFGEEFAKDWRETVLGDEFSKEDQEMSRMMMSYYTNFAKTGNPNEGLDVPVPWPQYTTDHKEYLQFAEETQVLVENAEELERYRFWTEMFPDIAYSNI